MTRLLVLGCLLGALGTWGVAHAQEAETPAPPAPEDIEVEDIEVEDIEVEDVEVEDAEVEDAGAGTPDTSIVLPDVVVRYRLQELARVGGSAHLISEADLAKFEHDDPHAVLLEVPGVYLRQEDGYGLRPNIGLRGASSDRSKKVTLMEDGILFGPAPYSAPAAYYFPLMTRMQGVEVFKGPASIRYGPNTIGGAINLVTRAIPPKSAAMLDLAYGMDNYGKLHGHAGTRNKWGGLLVEGVVLTSDGFKELDGGGNTGFYRGEFMLKGMVQSDPLETVYHRADVKVGYALETSRETYLGLTDADFRTQPNRRYAASALDRMQNDRLQLQLGYALKVGDWLDVKAIGYRHGYERTWRKLGHFRGGPTLSQILASPDSGSRAVLYNILTGAEDSNQGVLDEALMIGTNARGYESQGVVLQGRVDFDTGRLAHDVEVGLRLHHDAVERIHTEEAYWMESAALVHAGDDEVLSVDNRASTLALAGHVVYGLSGWGLTLSPGLRFESIHASSFDELADTSSPNEQLVGLFGFGAHYAILPGFGILAGVHQGFSPVAPGQGPEVEPERSVNYELGARYIRPSSSTIVEAVGFVSDYTNLIGECTLSSGCSADQLDRQSNAGEVLVAGLELVAGHRFQLGSGLSLPLRLVYTFTHAEFQTDFNSDNPQFGQVKQGDALPYVPAHQMALQAGIEGKRWGVSVHGALVDEMRETAGQGEVDPSEVTDLQVMVDLVARVEALPGVEGYLKVDNLLMTQGIVSRRPYGARPGKPFSLSVGFKLHF